MDRRDGRRGRAVFEVSGVGLGKGDSSSSSVETGERGFAKSIASTESSRLALAGDIGGEAMAVSKVLYSWHESIMDFPNYKSSR